MIIIANIISLANVCKRSFLFTFVREGSILAMHKISCKSIQQSLFFEIQARFTMRVCFELRADPQQSLHSSSILSLDKRQSQRLIRFVCEAQVVYIQNIVRTLAFFDIVISQQERSTLILNVMIGFCFQLMEVFSVPSFLLPSTDTPRIYSTAGDTKIVLQHTHSA